MDARSVSSSTRMLARCVLVIAILKAVTEEAFGFELSRSMPMQMDLAAKKHITICTGLKRYIACRDGSNIAITYAFWGRTSDKICPSDDGDPVTDCEGAEETLALVKGYCETKDGCQLEARHNKLQRNGTHHCPGVNKYLIVNYTCIPESSEVLLCESETTALECQAGWVMEVTAVFWGRRANGGQVCGAEAGMECDSSDYASKYLRNKCKDKQRCEIQASSEMLDDKKGPCAGMLKYLRVSYVCRPQKSTRQSGDDENEAFVESKLLTDTSSKELMGLLEKHLNEIKTPETSFNMQRTEDRKSEKYSGSKLLKGGSPASAASKARSRETLSRLTQPSYATEDDDFVGALMSGPAFTRSIKSDKWKDDASQKKNETGADLTSLISVVSKSTTQKKDQVSKPAKELETIPRLIKSDETLSPDLKEAATAKLAQAGAGITQSVAKDTVAKPISTATEQDKSDLSKPQAVKSILARATVLKALDNDSEDLKDVNTKSGISRKINDNSQNDMSRNLRKSMTETIPKSSLTINKIAEVHEAARSSVPQPKPGLQKPGLRATGPAAAGVGNTP